MMIRKYKRIFAITAMVLLLILSVVPIAQAAQSFAAVVKQIDTHLNDSITTYKQGNVDEAKKLVDEAYFGPYESGQMEKAVRLNISAKRNSEVEIAFRQLKKDMTKGAAPEQIQQDIDELVTGLRADAKSLDGEGSGTGLGAFFSSFMIIVREGFEAILVIGAIIAYLVKSGHKEKVKIIYQSTGAALLASLLTAWAMTSLFKVSGASRELLEGVTMLIAVAVLFSVSYWLVSKSESRRWKDYIEGQIQGSINKGNAMTLWFAAFLAVYREGAETVLFYQALMSGSTEFGMILGGIVAGLVALVLIYLTMRFVSVKIPMKPFFLGTSFLLYYLAFTFAGQGVGELQAAGVVSATAIEIPTVTWLGIYPTLESLAPQVLLLILAAIAFVYQQRLSKKEITAGGKAQV
jgi:high-affinity iron transporter